MAQIIKTITRQLKVTHGEDEEEDFITIEYQPPLAPGELIRLVKAEVKRLGYLHAEVTDPSPEDLINHRFNATENYRTD